MVDLFSMHGKIAVVTGGSSGIGKMIATGFLEAGASVYLVSLSEDECRAAVEELSDKGPCDFVVGDVSTDEGCRALAAALKEKSSVINVLVNSAGAHSAAHPLEDYPDDEWGRIYATHVKAPFEMTRALLPELRSGASDEDPARVINIGSVAGTMVLPVPMFAYQSAKAALHHLTKRLAKELAPDRITVNAILPGVVPTPWFKGNEGVLEVAAAADPLGRNNDANDLAGAAIYLASTAGANVTGVLLPVDGGMSTTI